MKVLLNERSNINSIIKGIPGNTEAIIGLQFSKRAFTKKIGISMQIGISFPRALSDAQMKIFEGAVIHELTGEITT